MAATLRQDTQRDIFMTSHRNRRRDWTRAMLLACACGLGALDASAAWAQTDAAPVPAEMMVVDARKLVDQFVKAGVLTREQAETIIANSLTPAGAATPLAAQGVVPGGVEGDEQTVPYIPDVVRNQIKAELRAELGRQAQAEGWARPGETPEWTRRFKLSGDLRIRGEGVFFPQSRLGGIDPLTNTPIVLGGNDPSIVNFGAINGGAPYNINRSIVGSPNPPYLNTTEDRNRARIRARFGFDAQLTRSITAQIRLATGNDTSPVSTNQTLGGGNGDFSKYSIWLDRANLQFAPGGMLRGLNIVVGRAENPFRTTDMIFDEDLNFDGISMELSKPVDDTLTLFGTLGAFPTYNTDFNFGSRDVSAFPSNDRWLLGSQLGAEVTLAKEVKLSASVGYLHFTAARGQVSSPCLFNQDVCDTDNTRPLFQQYGNTLIPLRTLIPDPAAPLGSSPEPQYFGLASKFHVLTVQGALDLGYFANVPIRIEGEFIRNLAFNRGYLRSVQANVPGSPYTPGGTGWSANVTVGTPRPGSWGEWTAFGGYRRVGTDATVDAFTDSDFHLGGTNAKGYVLGGAFGLGGGTSLGARWLSADEITGQPYSVDVLHIDLTARF